MDVSPVVSEGWSHLALHVQGLLVSSCCPMVGVSVNYHILGEAALVMRAEEGLCVISHFVTVFL